MEHVLVVHRFVESLPDLLSPADYAADPEGRRVRLRLRLTAEGVEILGDAHRPVELDRLLEALSPEAIERLLCG